MPQKKILTNEINKRLSTESFKPWRYCYESCNTALFGKHIILNWKKKKRVSGAFSSIRSLPQCIMFLLFVTPLLETAEACGVYVPMLSISILALLLRA